MITLTGFQKLRLNLQLNSLAKKRAFAVSQNMPTTAFDRMMKAKEELLRDPAKPEPVTIAEVDGSDIDAVSTSSNAVTSAK